MTKQEIFDAGATGVIKQGRPAIDRGMAGGSNLCAYRGEGGTKCFLGHLIPDDRYTPHLEGLGPADLDLTSAMGLGMADEMMERFLNDCQGAHDNAAAQNPSGVAFLNDFKLRALAVAVDWNLSTEVLS